MPGFNKDLWRKRATARWERRRSSGSSCQLKSDERLNTDMTSIEMLDRLVNWCSRKKITIDFKHLSGSENGSFYGQKMLIEVSSRLRPEAQLHVLLHECGHYQILCAAVQHDKRSRDASRFDKVVFEQHDRSVLPRGIELKMLEVEEEFEAWFRGKRLASRLGIQLDLDSFEKTKVDSVRTYVDWAATSPRKTRTKPKLVSSSLGIAIATPTIDAILSDEEKEARRASQP